VPRPEAMASQTGRQEHNPVRQGACDIFEEKQDQERRSTVGEGKSGRIENGKKGKSHII